MLSMISVITAAAALGAGAAAQPATGETVLVYRLRGEVRPLFFWVGKDDVGGGRVTIRRNGPGAGGEWREEIEVLFGSDPDRIPRRVNRWGYGRESAQWSNENGRPRLLRTIFEGIMRHSDESSIDQVPAEPANGAAGARFIYDATRSTVLPEEANYQVHILADDREFHYKEPGPLLSRCFEALKNGKPTRGRKLANSPSVYGQPYGFLSGLRALTNQIVETNKRQPDALQQTRPSLKFVFNSKPYTLTVTDVKRIRRVSMRKASFDNLAMVEFRCFNTVKRTRTNFDLWIPLSGELEGLPVRIRLQPRWWLRLQMDLDR